jgi:outer membrane protein assembly factor BamB
VGHYSTGSNLMGVYCLNETVGSSIWKFEVFSTVGPMDTLTPMVAGSRVYFSIIADQPPNYSNIATCCLDESNGELIWKTQHYVSRVPLAIAYNKVFLSSEDGYLYAFSAETGEILWNHYVGFASYATSASPPAVADGKVFVSTSESIISLNVTTGDVVWTYSVSGANPPIVADGYVMYSIPGVVIPDLPNTAILTMLLIITAVAVVFLRRKIEGFSVGH